MITRVAPSTEDVPRLVRRGESARPIGRRSERRYGPVVFAPPPEGPRRNARNGACGALPEQHSALPFRSASRWRHRRERALRGRSLRGAARSAPASEDSSREAPVPWGSGGSAAPPAASKITTSCTLRRGPLAQLAEQQTFNLRVRGSIPRRPTSSQFGGVQAAVGKIAGALLVHLSSRTVYPGRLPAPRRLPTDAPPSQVRVLSHRGASVPELVGDQPRAQSCLIQDRGSGLAEHVAG